MKKILLLVSLFVLSATPVLAVSIPVITGCTDPSAFNYNSSANTNDGSCIAVVIGCAEKGHFNTDPEVNTPDNSTCFNVGYSSLILLQQSFNPANYNVEVVGNAVTIQYLTTQAGSGAVRIINKNTMEERVVINEDVEVYHTVWVSLEQGTYEVTPIVGTSYGLTKVIEVK